MSQQANKSPSALSPSKRVGWTQEEAELSIGGLPNVGVTSNFDPECFDLEDFAEKLRRRAAAEAAGKVGEPAARPGGSEEAELDNPFVMTLAELQAMASSQSASACSVGRQVDGDNDEVRYEVRCATRPGRSAHTVSGTGAGTTPVTKTSSADSYTTPVRSDDGLRHHGDDAGQRRRSHGNNGGGLEWDYDIQPERINQTRSQRFRQSQDLGRSDVILGESDDIALSQSPIASESAHEEEHKSSTAQPAMTSQQSAVTSQQSAVTSQRSAMTSQAAPSRTRLPSAPSSSSSTAPVTSNAVKESIAEANAARYGNDRRRNHSVNGQRHEAHPAMTPSTRSSQSSARRPVVAMPVELPVATPVVETRAQQDRSKEDDARRCMDMLTSSAEREDGRAWLHASQRLYWLSESWPGTRDLAHHSMCITGIVEFMRQHHTVVDVVSVGCLLLLSLCRNHTENHVELDTADGLDVIVQAIRDFEASDESLAFNGIQCIAVMAVPGRHDEELVHYNDLVALVVDGMRVHLLHEGVQSAGCWALANMCCNGGIDQEEMRSFGLAAVLHAINQWPKSVLVMKEAIKALANMYHSDANRDNLLSSGALEEVPDALYSFPSSAEITSTALISIATFAATDKLRQSLCTPKLVECILCRMRDMPHSATVQEAACWALANLVTTSTTSLLATGSVLSTVYSVLYREPLLETLQTMGCMLLYNLACAGKYRVDIVLCGAAKLAVNAVRRLVRQDKAVMAAVKLLAILSHECPGKPSAGLPDDGSMQLGRLSVVEAAGVEALATAMQVYDTNLALNNMALLAFQHLSEITASHAVLTSHNVMEAILKTSGFFRHEQQIVDRVLAILENVLLTKPAVDVFVAYGGLHILASLMEQYTTEVLTLTRSAVILARVAAADTKSEYWSAASTLDSKSDALKTSPLCSPADAKALCVAKAGGIWLLKTAMERFPRHPALQAAGCQAMTCIAKNEVVADLMVKSDCIVAIASGMLKCKEYRLVQERGASALLELCNVTGFTGRFYRAHGDTAAKEAHRRYPDCDAIVYLANHIVSE